MENRLRWMQGATALLYFGPLLAGLGGFGWSVVPVFAAIFVLWLFILRPQQWPRRLSDWQRPEALVTLASQLAVQLLLVLVCFGIGRGIGGVLGALPPFPLMLPVAISFLSIPICRMIWDPWKMAEMDRFLDDALAQVQGTAAQPDRTARQARARSMLAALPPGLSPDDMTGHLRAMEEGVGPEVLAETLLSMASAGGGAETLCALTVLATEGRLVEIVGGDLPTRAFQLLPNDPALVGLFARRAVAVLDSDPDLYGDFPQADLLKERRAALSGTEAAVALGDLLACYDRIVGGRADAARG